MKRLFAAIMSVAVFGALAPVVDAQSSCPTEVQQAKEMFGKVAKTPDVQAPRTLAGARPERQAPGGKEDGQEPRAHAGGRNPGEEQAARGEEGVEAVGGQEGDQAARDEHG